MEVEFIIEDITKIGKKADAIVNAANKTLLGGGGVDGVIHRAAGPELLEECRKLHGCKPGEAKVTKAYRLDNKYIIHAVGPYYPADPNHAKTLENCYLNSLKLADELKLKTIAFPPISTGIYEYPVEEAAAVVAKVISEYQPSSLEKVYICDYGKDAQEKIAQYKLAFEKYLNK